MTARAATATRKIAKNVGSIHGIDPGSDFPYRKSGLESALALRKGKFCHLTTKA
jgi:hypothetical protein